MPYFLQQELFAAAERFRKAGKTEILGCAAVDDPLVDAYFIGI